MTRDNLIDWLIATAQQRGASRVDLDGEIETVNDICREAVTMLEEDCNRVLELWEATGIGQAVFLEVYNTGFVSPVYVTIDGTKPTAWVGVHMIGTSSKTLYSTNLYGMSWRCWLRRPSDDERKNVPWNNRKGEQS